MPTQQNSLFKVFFAGINRGAGDLRVQRVFVIELAAVHEGGVGSVLNANGDLSRLLCSVHLLLTATQC